MISLGCAKNLVDSEIMLGDLQRAGYEMTNSAGEADVIVVNTCGFIGPAKEESINTILEMANYKQTHRCRALIVTGCLSQRYGQELMWEMPEIDGMLGTGELDRLPELLEAVFGGERPLYIGQPGYNYDGPLPRLVTTAPHSVYLKIAEGCSHSCAYCVIPAIRGPYRSRSMVSIIEEAKRLVLDGAKELILIAQDTSAYGKDLPGSPGLPELLQELSKLPDIHWLRVLYTYPTTFSARLIDEYVRNPKVCHYVDLPLQHASNHVLRRMGRGAVAKAQRQLIDRLRKAIPDVALRSSFIVGFPGETETDFKELLDFLEDVKFDHVGIFTYSAEEGSRAARLPDQIPESVKKERWHRAMSLQQEIAEKKNQARVGRVYEVLIDGPSEETDLVLTARSQYQAPEVDGQIYIGNRWLPAGELAQARIIESHTYDLVAEILDESGEG
ncbi:MAG: 30S ribosomal protein S12 methylthiotransferase RimO [Firmicutes bacterium]|nr:30S ribosomal protein S12 methylthiotransferase RimO [Bacillota bacterium]